MAGEAGGRAIFISYRRDDSEGEAGRLFDDLVRAFGENSVFMDVSGIQPGKDFRKAIDENVATCGVLLAIVGPHWSSIADAHGIRRLDNEHDFVRLEIASALARSVAVIPVLVHEARMPSADQLPENLKDLSYRNSVELTHARWNSDVALLVNALQSYVTVAKEHATETVHATIPVQLPAPTAPVPASKPEPASPSKMPLFAGVGVAAALAIGLGIFFANRKGPDAPKPENTPVAAPANTPPASAPVAVDRVMPTARFLGGWRNNANLKPQDSLTRVVVTGGGSSLLVHAFAKCATGECDWGVQPATVDGTRATTGPYTPRNTPEEVLRGRSVAITLRPTGDGMDVTVQNSYANPGQGPTLQDHTSQYTKIPTAD